MNEDELRADLVHYAQTIARQAHAALLGDSEAIALTPLEGLVMQYIDRNPGVRSTAIATAMGLQSSNASTAVRELERKGLIRRESDPLDRRASRIQPTAAAQRNLTHIRAHWVRLLAPLPVTQAQLASAVEVLRAVEETLAEHAPRP